MTDLGEPIRRWEDEPLHEPVPGEPVPDYGDPDSPAPVEDPAEVPVEV